MPLSLASPEDIANNALVRIGYKLRIGSIYDGSEASKKILDIYAQTRDALLRSDDWGFAERNVPLSLLKTAPPGGYVSIIWSDAYPILPWRYEYAYPDDTLEVRSIRSSPVLIPNFDPKPNVWRIANASNRRVILSNVVNAILIYTGQVTDPLQWEPLFTETLCASLGRRLAPVLSSLDVAKLEAGDEVAAATIGERIQG